MSCYFTHTKPQRFRIFTNNFTCADSSFINSAAIFLVVKFGFRKIKKKAEIIDNYCCSVASFSSLSNILILKTKKSKIWKFFALTTLKNSKSFFKVLASIFFFRKNTCLCAKVSPLIKSGFAASFFVIHQENHSTSWSILFFV